MYTCQDCGHVQNDGGLCDVCMSHLQRNTSPEAAVKEVKDGDRR
jgi:recombinational DNA repair protein RecR